MSRIVLALGLTALLVAGWLATPFDSPAPDDFGLEPAAAAAAVCPVRLDRNVDGKMTVASSVIAPVRITVGSGGEVVTDLDVPVGEAGGAAVPFEDLTVAGTAGAFVEFPVPASAAATVSRGEAGVTGASCPTLVRTTSVITGASTRNSESLELILVNPYGSDAVVSVESASEIGPDSADALASVVVPARSTVTRDIATLLPLRNRLSFTLTQVRGLVHAFVEGGGRGDRVMLEHVEPRSEWIAPLPVLDGVTTSLVVSTASPVDVVFRLDGWVDGEFVEGVLSETIPARGQVEIVLADLGATLDIVQVLADGPIGVSIVADGEAGRAATPANGEALLEWFMPGPGSAGSVAWIGVTGENDATIEFLSLDSNAESFTVQAPLGVLTPVPLDGQLIGYALRADAPITVLWSVSDDNGIGFGTPFPLPGGE